MGLGPGSELASPKHPVPSRDEICGHRKARKAGLEVRTSEHRGGRGVGAVPATPAGLLGPGSTQTPQHLPTAPPEMLSRVRPAAPHPESSAEGPGTLSLSNSSTGHTPAVGASGPQSATQPWGGTRQTPPRGQGHQPRGGGGRNGHRSPSRFTKLRNSGTYRGPSPLTGKGWPEVRRGPPTASRGETQGTARVPAGQGQERRVT